MPEHKLEEIAGRKSVSDRALRSPVPMALTDEEEAPPSLYEYGLVVLEHWRWVAAAAFLAAIVTFLITAFAMTHYYRVSALLRPVDQSNQLSGPMGALGAAAGALGSLQSDIPMLSALGGQTDDKVQEYLAILQSYDFTMDLVDKHHLAAYLNPPRAPWLQRLFPRDEQWHLYDTMNYRFDTDYDKMTGNVTLHFMDESRSEAKRILQLYIDSLRQKLRKEEVQSSSEAITALSEQAKNTVDPTLQSRLYSLIASQIERQTEAEVTADFDFVVIDHPAGPGKVYKPRVVLDSALAGFVGALIAALILAARDSRRRSYEDRSQRKSTMAVEQSGE